MISWHYPGPAGKLISSQLGSCSPAAADHRHRKTMQRTNSELPIGTAIQHWPHRAQSPYDSSTLLLHVAVRNIAAAN